MFQREVYVIVKCTRKNILHPHHHHDHLHQHRRRLQILILPADYANDPVPFLVTLWNGDLNQILFRCFEFKVTERHTFIFQVGLEGLFINERWHGRHKSRLVVPHKQSYDHVWERFVISQLGILENENC